MSGRHELAQPARPSQPGRWRIWLVSALGLAVLAGTAVVAVPTIGVPTADVVRLVGPIHTPTVAPTARVEPPRTVTVTAPPVEVPPPTARVHRGDFVGDCFLSDPLTPIYLCPGG